MAIEILYNHSEESTTFLGSDSGMEALRDFAESRGLPGELSAGSVDAAGGETSAGQARLLFRGLSQEAAEALLTESGLVDSE